MARCVTLVSKGINIIVVKPGLSRNDDNSDKNSTHFSDNEPVVRHDAFRLFACMNPATDVGKKDLPSGIRNRYVSVFPMYEWKLQSFDA